MPDVIPWERDKRSGQLNCPNFLPGDTFQITVQEGHSQREHLEIAEQSSRKERATQKMMVVPVLFRATYTQDEIPQVWEKNAQGL